MGYALATLSTVTEAPTQRQRFPRLVNALYLETIESMQAALSATPAVLTIELEPEAVMEQAPPPALTRDAAEVMATAVANDLQRILGDEVRSGGMILLGAVYDLTELLRPGLPVVEGLLDYYRASLRGGPFEPQLIALGSAAGEFPVPELAPRRAPGSGPLLALPFALVAPGPDLEPLRETMESELLGKGRASLDTDRTVQQLFSIAPVNLSYATLHDVSALLRVQLEHAGFGPLWQLLEAALYRPDEPTVVTTDTGNRFLTHQGQAWTPILDFDAWAAARDAPAEADYLAWQKTQRQYIAGLSAHGITVTPTVARPGIYSADAEVALSIAQAAALDPGDRLRVPITGDPEPDSAAIVALTEHASPELGPIAYSVMVQGADGGVQYLGHDYPLAPEAIAAIRDDWQRFAAAMGARFHMEQPGRLLVGGEPPALMPWFDNHGPPN